MVPALRINTVTPMGDGGVHQTNAGGEKLYQINFDTRCTSGKITNHTESIWATNAAGIRQQLREIARADDTDDKRPKLTVPAPILAIVGIAVDYSYDPVSDWE